MINGLDAHIPGGPIDKKWDLHKFESKLINPANRRKYEIIIVGSGLAGASAAATLGELGYRVKCFCYQDSPRRAHSIAAQGGINAAKNYQNDGDSVFRLFYDTIKGGDFRSREANVYRLAQVSTAIIDQCVAQGVPFAREYGGLLANRSFGGAQVSRTFYARGQTGQQLLLGAYGALCKQIAEGNVQMFPRTRNAGRRRRGRTREGNRRPRPCDREGLFACWGHGRPGDRRLRQRVLPLDQRERMQRHGNMARPTERGVFRESLLHANPSHVHPGGRGLPVEADPHVRIAPQRRPRLGAEKGKATTVRPGRIPEEERDYYLERKYPSLRQPGPARYLLARRQAGVRRRAAESASPAASASISISGTPFRAWARVTIRERYGNLFDMYHKITDENAYKRADAHLSRPCTTQWAACGWIITS